MLKPVDEISPSAAKMRLLKRLKCTLKFEKQAWAAGATLVAGVDEVGRGAFFGPVVAGAVILDPHYRIRGLRDSKLLPAPRREILAQRIKDHCIAWAVAAVDAARIDQINIYHASLLAMVEAVTQLQPPPDHLLLDAVRVAVRVPADQDHSRRRPIGLDRRGLHRRQGLPRRTRQPLGAGVSRLRSRLQQGLPQPQAHRQPAQVRALAAASPVVRAGVDGAASAGSPGIHAVGK